MSKASKSSKSSTRQNMGPEFVAAVSQFMAVTGSSKEDGARYIRDHGKVDIAIDAYYRNPETIANYQNRRESNQYSQVQKLNILFDNYKSSGSGEGDITSIDGTIRLCADLEVDPEDVVLLAVAYELKAPAVGEFSRAGWRDGWRNLSVDSLAGMKNLLPRLRRNLGCDFAYFKKVYLYTFDFARSEGQRSLATDSALAFWGLLLPHAIQGGALAHVEDDEDDGDENNQPMGDPSQGWTDEHTQWWFDFLTEKGTKGISRDTWNMFLSFVRTADSRFEKHDFQAAWPSTIDDFVEWAKEHRLASG